MLSLAVSSPQTPTTSPFPKFSAQLATSLELEKEGSSLAPPSPPRRTASPFPCHPFVTDAESLQISVSENPGRILEAIQNLVNERDALRLELAHTSAELQSATEDLANTRVDHKTARRRYEELFRIASSKQSVLWKYIESLSQLAAGKDIPDFNGGNGMGVVARGGSSMNAAMEKWISEGVDSDRGSKVAEEGSEKGTEHSFWSADDSVGTNNLNPDAVSVLPTRRIRNEVIC